MNGTGAKNKNVDNLTVVKKYSFFILKYWYFVVIGLILGAVLGYIKNRYEQPIYSIKSQVVTKKFDNNDMAPLIGNAGGLRFKKQVDAQRERAKILSKQVMLSVANKVDFSVSYFIEGDILTKELYNSKPFSLACDTAERLPYGSKITLLPKGQDGFQLRSDNPRLNSKLEKKTFLFGESYSIDSFHFSISKGSGSYLTRDVEYYMNFNRKEDIANSYRNRITIRWDDKNTSLINFEMASLLPEKDVVFMRKFLQVLIDNDLDEKKEESQKTIDFINKQVAKIEDSLFVLDTYIDRIRLVNNKATQGTDLFFKEIDSLTDMQARMYVQNSYLDYLKDYVKSNKNDDLFAPVYLGIDDEFINNFVKKYLDIKAEGRLFKSDSNAKNPLVNLKGQKERRFEQNMFENIKNINQDNDKRINNINRQINQLQNEIPTIQVLSNELKQIKRRALLNEKILELFLQRRTEAELMIAKTLSNYEIIDEPSISVSTATPDKTKTLIQYLLMGLLVPIVILAGIKYFNPYVQDSDQIHQYVDFPIIGEIPHNEVFENLALKDSPSSHLSEAFRSVRAKLNYYLTGNTSHVIAITSSLSGEGKSFTSANLASFYAISGKKTVVVGADLRRPSLGQYFVNYPRKGLSNFLVGDIDKSELIVKSDIENLWFIPAGDIPPNPYEMIAGNKFQELLGMLREEFDIILFDTSPLMLVSDALPIIKIADVNVLVVRYNKTYVRSLESISELVETQEIKNFAILFNDVDKVHLRYKYGYKYKYKYKYYYETKQS